MVAYTTANVDITEDIVVYRFSEAKTTDYMKQKVSRLAAHSVLDDSKTITRSFAREGLTDDGKEDILKSTSLFAFRPYVVVF